MCVREGEVLSVVPKADKQCSAVRDPGSWDKVLHRVPWIHIKYVKSCSHGQVEKLCKPRNSCWVAAHHTPQDRDVLRAGQLPAASTPTEESKSQESSARKVSPRRVQDMLGFCFVTWWLRWAQISEVSITPVQRHICMPVAYTVSKTWISRKILVLQVILQVIATANFCKVFANYC